VVCVCFNPCAAEQTIISMQQLLPDCQAA